MLRASTLLVIAALAMSCKHDASSPFRIEDRAPIAAPSTLTAEGALREPDALWRRFRRGSGAAAGGLPDTAAGAVMAWAGADPSLAPLVRGDSPFYVALGDAAEGGLAYALAMKLAKPDAVRSALTEGDASQFQVEQSDGLLRLVARQGVPSTLGVALSATGYLVVASSPADLATLGGYAARTLPTKDLPQGPFELRMDSAALARAGKRAPDFADKATSILADAARGVLPQEVDANAVAACFTPEIQNLAATASDLAQARLDVEADEAKVDVVVTMTPKAGDNRASRRLAAMQLGPAGGLLDAPAEAIVTVYSLDAAAARADDAGTLGPCLGGALAPILGANGATKLAGAVMSWARGRGDWERAAFVARPSVAGLVLSTPSQDTSSASSSMRAFADLAAQPGLADALRRMLPLRAGQVQPAQVLGVGDASVLLFQQHAPAARLDGDTSTATAALTPPGLAWAVSDREIDVGLGQSPKELLAMTQPGAKLRTTPGAATASPLLAKDVSFAAFVAPPGCCTSPAPSSAALTFVWGRKDGNGQATFDVGDELLGQILAHELAH